MAYNFHPFGMLMPGRYTSDTNSRCLLVSRSTWTTTMMDSCYPPVQLTGTATTLGTATYNSPGGGTFAAAAPRATDAVVLNQTIASGIDNILTFDVVDLKEGDEEGVLVTVLETIDNVPYVIEGGRLRQGKDQRISFRSTGNNIQVVLNGPYTNLILAQICTHYARSTAQTYLVEVCDESKDRYKFGFQGQEKDNELKGVGNSLDFGARIYDSRVARWLSVDNIKKNHLSSYQFGRNSPIVLIDPDGNTEYYFNGKWVASDNQKNGLIGIVKTKGVNKQIKKGTFLYPEPISMKNGDNTNEIFVIESNVLSKANEVLKLSLSEKGENREFGTTMYRDEENPGRYRAAYNGIQEGKEFDLNTAVGMSVELLGGDISIHSHATGVGKINGRNMNADEASGGDMGNMDKEDMTIIVGKKKRSDITAEIVTKDELGVPLKESKTIYHDGRGKSGTIEIYDKDNKSKAVQSISGSDAQKIIDDYSKR
ncbi:MAG TPA: RHS repeat-associated core domain-containing protein [Edaphocola sp.]|nr:RHS repeat-associated core domain-containing protein [Edaphocola sp.]